MSGKDYLDQLIVEEQLPEGFRAIVGQYYRPLARALANARQGQPAPMIVGINGAQGTGKSTLSLFLSVLLDEVGLSSAVLSLDDIYLTHGERLHLAETVHPLLAVRGVPGTHDIGLGLAMLNALATAGPDSSTPLPAFDKAVDDRKPEPQWPVVVGRPDVIILEGWCLGAVPQAQAELIEPVNELEHSRDRDGRWRQYVNDKLAGDYQTLFARIDKLVMIKAPDWHQVYQWRLLQERKLQERCKALGLDTARVMTPEQISDFVSYYERLTRHQLAEMPRRADAVLSMAENHRIVAMDGPLFRVN